MRKASQAARKSLSRRWITNYGKSFTISNPSRALDAASTQPDVGRGVARPFHAGQQGEGEAGWEGARWEGVAHARPCIWKTRGVDDALHGVQCLRQQGVHPEQVPQVLRQGRPAVRAAPRGDTEYVVFSGCDFEVGWHGKAAGMHITV